MKSFEEQLDSLFGERFNELNNSSLIKLSELKNGDLPKSGGIYVFYDEKDEPIYVGRTKNIRQRIQLHTRDGSKHESATFVFNLAKKEYRVLFPDKLKTTRKLLMNEIEFIPIFNLQKDRVKKMSLKYINEEHDILQTILEPYFAIKLKTYPKHQTFKTH
jgi:excinuclease UvrABC nuclease subunit